MATTRSLIDIINAVLTEQLPDADSFNLENIYQELERVHALRDSIDYSKTETLGPGSAEDEDEFYSEYDHVAVRNFAGIHDTALWHTQHDAIQHVEQYRGTLWSRAQMLSRDGVRRLGIFDLPSELMETVLGYFEHQEPIPGDRWQPMRQENACNCLTIQKLRLTCRSMDELASPYLFPEARLDVDQASLDFLTDISHRPFLARGVRTIKIDLSYCPQELAANINLYRSYLQEDVIGSCASMINYNLEYWTLSDLDENLPSRAKYPCHVYRKAMDRYHLIRTAWRDFEEEEDPQDPKPSKELYKTTLHNSHAKFARLHDEQYRLIRDGTFARMVGSAMSRMPFTDSIWLDDFTYPKEWPDSTDIILNEDILEERITRPLRWKTMDDLMTPSRGIRSGSIHISSLPPVKLLVTIPVAIHNAGVKLRQLHSRTFPRIRYFDELGEAMKEHGSDLHAAVQSLEVLSVRGNNHRPYRKAPLDIATSSSINTFFTALLSGRSLRKLILSTSTMMWTAKGNIDHGFALGPALANNEWPHLEHLRLSDVSFSQDELEKFCSVIPYGIKSIDFFSIDLDNGSWYKSVELLRDCVFTVREDKPCKFTWSRIRGREIPPKKKKKREFWDITFDSSDDSEPGVVEHAELYIRGGLDENPFQVPVNGCSEQPPI